MSFLECIYKKNIALESNCYYRADRERYDFYLEDTIVAEEEEYRSWSSSCKNPLNVAFCLKNLRNITLDFGGAELVFHGRITPFIFEECENITIKNCKINYDRPFYTEAKLLEADTSHIRIKISEGFPYRIEDGYLIVESETWEKCLNTRSARYQVYDPVTHAIAPVEFIYALVGKEIFPKTDLPLPVRHMMAEEDGDEIIIYGDFPGTWSAGYDLVITHEQRDKNIFTAIGCKDLKIEDVRILYGSSCGFLGLRSENLTFKNFSLYLDDEHPNLVTNNADVIHTFNCKGQILLEDCKMENMLDDPLNVHGTYMLVDSFEGNKLYAVTKGADLSTSLRNYMPGDRIAVCQGKTMRRKAEYTVVDVVAADESRYLVTLDRTPEGIEQGDLIENISRQADITVRNCTFGLFSGLMRLQSRGKILIENCSFAGEGTDILFSGDTTYWYESSPVQDVMIRNCDFQGSIDMLPEMEYCDEAMYYHENIHIDNCRFAKPDVLRAMHTNGLVFKNNSCDKGRMQLKLEQCGSCEADENCEIVC